VHTGWYVNAFAYPVLMGTPGATARDNPTDDGVAAVLQRTFVAARLSRERIADELAAAGQAELAWLYRSTIV
jgi:hypothetical protein